MRPASNLIPNHDPRPVRAGGLVCLWLTLLVVLLSAGCALKPFARKSAVTLCGNSAECSPQACCPVAEKISLTQVPLATRPDLSWQSLPSLAGQPLAISEAVSVRLLSWEELQTLAVQGDSTCQLLAAPLPCLERAETPACLRTALDFQAAHAGNLAIARASEALLGLQECYLQNQLLEQARQGSDRRERILEKFRTQGLPLDLDARELDRQRLELDRQFAQLAREYQTATVGLELLLNLSHEPTIPIWPTQPILPLGLPDDLPSCLERAQQKRADRQALLALQSCLGAVAPEQLTGQAGALSPWAELTIPPPPASWLLCRRADWEDAARSQLRTQLCALLAENQKQISLEVNLAFARRWTAIEQLRIADESIASLQQSLEDIEQLRAIEPVNMERFLELEQRLMAAESQRVTAVIEQAKSELDLAKAIGSLAERHQ